MLKGKLAFILLLLVSPSWAVEFNFTKCVDPVKFQQSLESITGLKFHADFSTDTVNGYITYNQATNGLYVQIYNLVGNNGTIHVSSSTLGPSVFSNLNSALTAAACPL